MKRADAPASLTHHDDAWQSFLARRPGWAEKRLRDDGVLYCLPTSAVDEALKLYRLERDDQFAEDDLAALCAEHRAIGWTARGPLRYRLLDKPLPLPQIEGLEGLLKLGWGQEHIDWVRRGEVPRERVPSPAGGGGAARRHQVVSRRAGRPPRAVGGVAGRGTSAASPPAAGRPVDAAAENAGHGGFSRAGGVLGRACSALRPLAGRRDDHLGPARS